MIVTTPPTLPFPSFKWRWASVAPTEGLNDPKVFLGALRAFLKFEGEPPSSAGLLSELAVVKTGTGTSVDLVRTKERNLIRNSGQYWKALGLLEKSDPVILLTPFGRAVASGAITMSAFATTAIATLALPNERVQSDHLAWVAAGISFKPLELILQILVQLKSYGHQQHYITKFELVRIIEPLSAIAASIVDYADTIMAYRQGKVSLTGWPDCARKANDHRMATEYLLFLTNYGYCTRLKLADHWNDKYLLALLDDTVITSILSVPISVDLQKTAKAINLTGVPDFVERQKIMREIFGRPQQAKFRKDVLVGSGGTCAVTGTQLEAALEAAHIIPVSERGPDTAANGLCLRSDIHTLFDGGHIRIEPTGILHLSDAATEDPVYCDLPKTITVPPYVSVQNLAWRWNYL